MNLVMAGEKPLIGDTPIDSGYGYDFTNDWDPEAAFRTQAYASKTRTEFDKLHATMIKMADTPTVTDCVPKAFDYDPDSPKRPVVQYVEYLADEATRASYEVERYGGYAAVRAFEQA